MNATLQARPAPSPFPAIPSITVPSPIPHIGISRAHDVPYWIKYKVLKIAQDLGKLEGYEIAKAVGVLEYNAATILQGEVRAFPELGAWVPADFLQGLQAGHGDNLSPFERAAIVLAEHDAAMATPDYFDEVLREFLGLKWRALGELLREEGGCL